MSPLNFAARAHGLPDRISLIENNNYAISTPQQRADGNRRTSLSKAAGYGIPGSDLSTGSDPIAVVRRCERPRSIERA